MKTLTINIPDDFNLDSREFLMLAASKLYEQGRLSLGQAATLAGLSKRAFAEIIGIYDISLFNYPASDLANDIASA
ncbi:hypothetical protein HYN59_07500 [Flavobacterium album]|uniref:Uncharacterized protein n=1 Tax=Flavobacterium album TaxID=2175091 RepID=A0A2S1QX52_9FLAO|nr:UPF0175 family protein [Flavobacterium album]AWH84978.1 hypothetical protein HYN59_07500 [Flavobacterium album]